MISFRQGLKFWVDLSVGLRDRRRHKRNLELRIKEEFLYARQLTVNIVVNCLHLKDDDSELVHHAFKKFSRKGWIELPYPQRTASEMHVYMIITLKGEARFDADLNYDRTSSHH